MRKGSFKRVTLHFIWAKSTNICPKSWRKNPYPKWLATNHQMFLHVSTCFYPSTVTQTCFRWGLNNRASIAIGMSKISRYTKESEPYAILRLSRPQNIGQLTQHMSAQNATIIVITKNKLQKRGWLNQPSWKICERQIGSFAQVGMK